MTKISDLSETEIRKLAEKRLADQAKSAARSKTRRAAKKSAGQKQISFWVPRGLAPKLRPAIQKFIDDETRKQAASAEQQSTGSGAGAVT
ncbi:MAG: hypothetical protein KDK08_23305 [Rhizobiaceae bacterium]|nr:hypothetical protein [Rhizobiaceae bacterium]